MGCYVTIPHLIAESSLSAAGRLRFRVLPPECLTMAPLPAYRLSQTSIIGFNILFGMPARNGAVPINKLPLLLSLVHVVAAC